MATPETHSVEFDPLAPSFDGDPNAAESDEHQVVEAEARELSAYTFDSDDKTLVGIGTSDSADSADSADSSPVNHFDISDGTLVGIGPAERAQRARAAELVDHSQHAESAPEGVPAPHSEPPGPFVASDDDEDASDRLPMQKGERWVLALSAVLLAAAAVALLRGVVPHSTAPRLHSAATVAPPPTANETRTRYVQFDTAAATSTETSALEIPITQAPEAPQVAVPQAPEAPQAAVPQAPEASQVAVPQAPEVPQAAVPQAAASRATAQREKQSALAPRRAATKWAGTDALGVLDVTSNPPSVLVLDGRPVGKAPCVIQLPSGLHTVLFVHPERGRMSVTVNVKAGQTTAASAGF